MMIAHSLGLTSWENITREKRKSLSYRNLIALLFQNMSIIMYAVAFCPSEHHSEHEHSQDKLHDEHSYDAHSDATLLNIDGSKPWGPVILATVLVNLSTLSGLFLLIVPTIRRGVLTKASSDLNSHGKLIDIIIPSFAVGALMATAVFLVLPEALHLIEGSHSAGEGGGADDHSGHNHRSLQDEHNANEDNEGVVFAKWGCAILGGFLLPAFLSLFFRGQSVREDDSAIASEEEDCKSCMEKDCGVPIGLATGSHNSASVYDADEEAGSVPEAPAVNSNQEVVIEELSESISVQVKTMINYRLAAAVLVGDIFCNLADGIFIGAAFLGCSSVTAISITLIALLHELPQELADFVILTRYAGLSATTACILNFVTGLAVCVGGLIVLAAKPTDEAVGLILAIAGGVYLSVAASESMPRVARYTEETSDKALSLFFTVVGTIPLGLVLLNHQHC